MREGSPLCTITLPFIQTGKFPNFFPRQTLFGHAGYDATKPCSESVGLISQSIGEL